jgi:hypothetical protein
MAITVADLKDQINSRDRNHPVLHCQECGSQFSANRGDYFMHPLTYPFFHCDRPMRLVRVETRMVEIDHDNQEEIGC